jgi:hypothetical protein
MYYKLSTISICGSCTVSYMFEKDEKIGGWPKSEFNNKKAVLLYERGSVVYTWLDMGIDEVLRSPTPPELIARLGLSDEALTEMLERYPEIAEHFIDALDHKISSGRLLEAVIIDKEFNLMEAIETEIDPEIEQEK